VGATGLRNVRTRSVDPPALGGYRISKWPERKWSS